MCVCVCAVSMSDLIAGAEGTVAAGLIPLCVEKLVQERNPQLKVRKIKNTGGQNHLQ